MLGLQVESGIVFTFAIPLRAFCCSLKLLHLLLRRALLHGSAEIQENAHWLTKSFKSLDELACQGWYFQCFHLWLRLKHGLNNDRLLSMSGRWLHEFKTPSPTSHSVLGMKDTKLHCSRSPPNSHCKKPVCFHLYPPFFASIECWHQESTRTWSTVKE